jgi:hypothetical protein
MPMMGGEAAEMAALARRPVADGEMADGRDPYDLGWVADWLYGDAVLPPMPLPRDPDPLPLVRRRQPATVHADIPALPPEPRRSGRRRRERQLALL